MTAQPTGRYLSQWGEGPIWHEHRLLYVDIEAHTIIRFDPATGEEHTWNVGQRVGTVVPRASSGLVFAGDNGFAFLDELSGAITPIANPEADQPRTRFNDGKCDPAGRFWAGTMDLQSPRQPIGALYTLFPDLSMERKFPGVACSNGLVWTRDEQTLYYIDTPRKNVLAFDYDTASGEIRNERIAFKTDHLSGNPDGMTIDHEDRLWIAFVHSGAVRCIDPLTGKVEGEVLLPVKEPTACAFGGPSLNDLFITTGSEKDVALAGSLFIARPGVSGVPAFTFAG